MNMQSRRERVFFQVYVHVFPGVCLGVCVCASVSRCEGVQRCLRAPVSVCVHEQKTEFLTQTVTNN